MFFRSEHHKERFLQAILRTGKVYDGGKIDQEYGAACYLLSCMPSVWEKAQSYVSADGIHFDTMLADEHLSSSELALVQLAGNLFNMGRTPASPVDWMMLDAGNFGAALQAIHLRRNGARLDDFK